MLDDIHGIGTSEVIHVEMVTTLSGHIVGEISIGLCSISFVDFRRMVSIKNGPFAISQPKRTAKSFPQAVDIITLELGTDLEIVVAVD